MAKSNELEKLKSNIEYFNQVIKSNQTFIESKSAIHCYLKSGNENVQKLEEKLASENFFVKSIKSPTVKINQERIRICLHSFNSKDDLDKIVLMLTNQ